jgi:hypothetical protein
MRCRARRRGRGRRMRWGARRRGRGRRMRCHIMEKYAITSPVPQK